MHVGNAGQVGQVKDPLMGLPVAPHKPRPVNGKYHREILNAHVMKHLIIGSLEKRGIDCEDRPKSSCRQPRRKSHRMRLRNAHIKKTLRVQVFKTF